MFCCELCRFQFCRYLHHTGVILLMAWVLYDSFRNEKREKEAKQQDGAADGTD